MVSDSVSGCTSGEAGNRYAVAGPDVLVSRGYIILVEAVARWTWCGSHPTVGGRAAGGWEEPRHGRPAQRDTALRLQRDRSHQRPPARRRSAPYSSSLSTIIILDKLWAGASASLHRSAFSAVSFFGVLFRTDSPRGILSGLLGTMGWSVDSGPAPQLFVGWIAWTNILFCLGIGMRRDRVKLGRGMVRCLAAQSRAPQRWYPAWSRLIVVAAARAFVCGSLRRLLSRVERNASLLLGDSWRDSVLR